MGGWVVCMCAPMLAVLLFVGRADAWLMVVVLTRASMLVELMSALRFVGLIFAVMLVALTGMMSCVVMVASLH